LLRNYLFKLGGFNFFMKSKGENINAEMEMIKDLRKRIYGDSDSSFKNKYSNHQCIFCGSENNLHLYKKKYICHTCLSDLRKNDFNN